MSAWSTGAAGLRTTVASSPGEVRALRDEWSALPLPVAAPSPATGPAFVEAWLATLGHDHEPRVVAARRDGRLVGVVPLAARARRPWEGGRQISLAGSRRPPMTDVADVRVLPGEEAALGDAVIRVLEASADDWDTLYLGNVAGGSLTFAAMLAMLEARRWPVATRSRAAMVIGTEMGWDAYRRTLGRTTRTLPRKLRGLRRIGDVRVELGLTGAEGAAALEQMLVMYRRRWGRGNWLEDPRYRECLRRWYAGLGDGAARMAGLWLDGHPLALQLVLREGDRDLGLMVAADRERRWRRYSPGMLLDYLLAEAAFADGTSEVHLLHTVIPAKVIWATRYVSELTLTAVSPRARRAVATAAVGVEAAIQARAVLRRGSR
jgi:CelD/BcsL family acetyltransferase involved in cellulose biosynthesis